MKHRYLHILIVFVALLVAGGGGTWSQGVAVQRMCPYSTTKGQDFWVMFLYNQRPNGNYSNDCGIYVMGDGQTDVDISLGDSLINQFSLSEPRYMSYQSCGDNQLQVATAFPGGYHITTSRDVWVYARNHVEQTCDATPVLPTSALGTRYIVQDYPSDESRGGEVGFLSTEENTVLSMVLPCNVHGTNLTAGTPLVVTLGRGEAYMLSADSGGSFTGMVVTSNNKPFALFQGSRNPAVPLGGSGRDHCYEQALPMDIWGKDFIFCTAPTSSSLNHVRVTSSADSCFLYRDSTQVAGPLAAGQTWQDTLLANTYYHLTSTKPAQVILYMGSYRNSGRNGDPSSITIPPLNRGICDVYFPCDTSSNIQNHEHHVTVICPLQYDYATMLDGQSISSQGTVQDVGQYRVRTVTANYSNSNQGRHHLSNSQSPFVAYAYGAGNWESYGFPLGFAIIDPSSIHRDTVTYRDTVCQQQAYTRHGFSVQASATQDTGTLFLMDSLTVDTLVHYHVLYLAALSTAQGDTSVVAYEGDTVVFEGSALVMPGDYSFRLTAANGCDSLVTLHLSFIEPTVTVRDTVYYADTLCQGQDYVGHGFAVDAAATREAGTLVLMDSTVTDTVAHYSMLALTVLPTFSNVMTLTIVAGDTVAVADTMLSLAGTYIFHFTTANGCDSTLTVTLLYEDTNMVASADGLCPGEALTLTAQGVHTFLWSAEPPDASLDSQQGQNPVTVHPVVTTVYSLLDAAGQVIASVTVGVADPPTLCVRRNREFLDLDHPVVTLDDCSEGRYSTEWLFSDGYRATTIHVRHMPQQPLPDTLTVTMTSCNRYNCCLDTTLAFPLKTRSVWFPNVFTPGGDDNRTFGCHTSCEVAEFHIWLYNCWGLLVWHSDDINERWDGTHDGTPSPQDAYVYHWVLKDRYGDRHSGTGTVTLLR